MAFDFRAGAKSGLYAAAGALEGLRRHREYVREDEKNRFAQKMDQERMMLDRYRVETGLMQSAEDIALREKEFINEKAKWQAQRELEEQKLKEQKRQYDLNFPLESRKVGALEKTAESRETSASAAVTRATAYGNKVSREGGALTPAGMMKEYSGFWKKTFGELMESHRQRYGKPTPEKIEEFRVEATNSAKAAIRESIEAYNENAYAYGYKPIGSADIAYQAEEEIEAEETDTEWEDMKADQTFYARFEGGELTDREKELLKQNDREMFQVYEREQIRRKLAKAKVNRPLRTSPPPPGRRPMDDR